MQKVIITTIAIITLTACSEPENKSANNTQNPNEVAKENVNTTAQPVEKVVITEFFDYGCGHCRNAHFTIKKLKEKYGDRIEVTEKHFPLSGTTFLVAETAECARDQGKFYEYHDALIEQNFGLYEPENLQKVAESVGIDIEEFNTCAANGVGKTRVQEDVNYAESLGVKGTPFFLINESVPVPGAIPEKSFDRLINQVLNGEVS